MVTDVDKGRSKRHHHKTRTGCVSCRRRRLKCDEAKPVCMRCIVLGQECAGYNIPTSQIFPPQDRGLDWPLPTVRLPPRTTIDDSVQQRALAFFRERTAPKMGGFTSFSNSFWTWLVPQLSQCEPAVRYVAIAVATKHEVLEETAKSPEELLAIYSKHRSLAIQELTQPSTQLSVDILLVCCVGFIALERLQCLDLRNEECLNHVVAGLKILDERSKSKTKQDCERFSLIDSLIEPMFFQIRLVFSMFRQPQRLVISCGLQEVESHRLEIPDRFQSSKSARDAFHLICWWRYYLSREAAIWSSSSPQFLSIRSLISQWHRAFRAYVESIPLDDQYERSIASLVKEQATVLAGAIEYSIRDNIPESCYCLSAAVELCTGSRISICLEIDSNRSCNLSGINHGRRSSSASLETWLWPRARRIRGIDGHEFIVLDLFGQPQSPK